MSSHQTRLTKLVESDAQRWSEAHHRLRNYLASYLLKDSLHESEITREILEEAIQVHKLHPEEHPTTCTLRVAQKTIAKWFASAMGQEQRAKIPEDQAGPIGHVTLLLSQVPQKWPASFLGPEMPDPLKRFFARSLMMTGPALNVASMTPRQFDYGPMLQLAQQTWHQWNTRQFLLALGFWVIVYCILYSVGYQILRLPTMEERG